MKPNTYVKIVSSGIANAVEELMPFIQGEEIMPLQEDESVEVRASVFNEGNIIIFRNRRTREVLSIIHTPHTVYIQEQNKTISTHRPTSSFLYGMQVNGERMVEPVFERIKLDDRFYAEASVELNEVMAVVLSVLEQASPTVIAATIEFDRFNIRCRNNVGLEPAFGYLQDALAAIGYNLTPVKGSEKTRYAIDYFYLDPLDTYLPVELDKEPMTDLTMAGQTAGSPEPDVNDVYTWPVDPNTKMPVNPESDLGKQLLGKTVKSILPMTFGPALESVQGIVNLDQSGQQGPK